MSMVHTRYAITKYVLHYIEPAPSAPAMPRRRQRAARRAVRAAARQLPLLRRLVDHTARAQPVVRAVQATGKAGSHTHAYGKERGMNELERFFGDWAQVYVLVSRLWRSRRAAGALCSATRQVSPDGSASSPATPAPPLPPHNDETAHARWTPIRPPLRATAAP